MDVIADTVPAFITERDASGKADLEMSVAYLFDVCRLKPVTVPAGILDDVTCCRSDILFPFLPDYCNETVYLVRITLVYPISAVMETVEALQAVLCIRVCFRFLRYISICRATMSQNFCPFSPSPLK